MTRQQVLELQRSFNRSGFAHQVLGEPLEEDGVYGPNTDAVYRAWLDRDTAVPTVTPQPAKPWWTHKALLGGVATIVASLLGVYGLEVDGGKLSEVLAGAVTAITGAITIWGAIKEQGGVDPTLVARAGNRTVRLPERVRRAEVRVAGVTSAEPPPDYARRTGREDLERWEH